MFGREARARKLMRHAVVSMRLAWGRECVRCRQRGEGAPAYGLERPTGLRLCHACWEAEPEDVKRKMAACHSVHRCPDELRKGHPGGGHTVLTVDVLVKVHVPECPYYEGWEGS